MADPVSSVSDELVDTRHYIYHTPEFVSNLDNLLCLQNMETRQRNLLQPDRMAKIKVPTLVIWGRENPFGDVPEAREMHEAIAGSELELLSHCGHWPQHEQSATYNKLSLTFLQRHSASNISK
jgi:2-hydroxy-6-oxonona-2,4-dienedioate hydrolase